jgi:hypothetical protein
LYLSSWIIWKITIPGQHGFGQQYTRNRFPLLQLYVRWMPLNTGQFVPWPKWYCALYHTLLLETK